MKQPRYYLDPLPLTPYTSPKVALECLVRSTGDTWGIVKLLHAGGMEFWRLGKKIGVYPNFKALYVEIDKII